MLRLIQLRTRCFSGEQVIGVFRDGAGDLAAVFLDEGFEVVDSLEKAFEKCKNDEEIFVLGGEEIFRLAIPFADKIYLTLVHETFEGDAFFPDFDTYLFDIIEEKKFEIDENTPYNISIFTYQRKALKE